MKKRKKKRKRKRKQKQKEKEKNKKEEKKIKKKKKKKRRKTLYKKMYLCPLSTLAKTPPNPQILMMSVAFEDQGEIVPFLGVTQTELAIK